MLRREFLKNVGLALVMPTLPLVKCNIAKDVQLIEISFVANADPFIHSLQYAKYLANGIIRRFQLTGPNLTAVPIKDPAS